MNTADKLTTIAENVPKVYAAGKQAGREGFWDAYQVRGYTNDYLYAFAGNRWTDTTYNPRYPIKPSGNAQLMYVYSGITDTKVPIDISGVRSNLVGTFQNARKLVTIRKLIVDEQTGPLTSVFNNANVLVNLTMEGILASSIDVQWCPLSKESITSVCNVLSSTITGKKVTFNKSAVNTAFGINVDDETTYPVGSEFYTLRHSKDNWTFSYV